MSGVLAQLITEKVKPCLDSWTAILLFYLFVCFVLFVLFEADEIPTFKIKVPGSSLNQQISSRGGADVFHKPEVGTIFPSTAMSACLLRPPLKVQRTPDTMMTQPSTERAGPWGRWRMHGVSNKRDEKIHAKASELVMK